jgi:hypothetical protein
MEVEQDLTELAEKGSIGVVHSRTRLQSYQRMDGGSTYDDLNLIATWRAFAPQIVRL